MLLSLCINTLGATVPPHTAHGKMGSLDAYVKTTHEKILVLRPNAKWTHWEERESFRKYLQDGIKELLEAAARHDGNAIKQKLRELVPEYQPFEL